MKGHGGGGSSGNNRARQYYGVMLCLAFGAAILGVMAVHKLRESRIFNLLLKEKDRDLLSLHLLLQKEREYNKETKRKSQEMKAKIHSLRTQKMDLDGRILEMQSTISSLKDEQRIMELALEEKQNEMKLLREKEMEASKEHPRIIALSETLKQKEAQIQDLQHFLENPSNSTVNLTKTEGTTWRDTKEATGELSDKTEEARDEAVGDGRIGGEKSIEGPDIKKEKNDTTATDAILNQGNGLRSREAAGGKELGMAWNGETDTRPRGGGGGGDGESQQFGMMNSRGGMKLEMSDNSQALTGHKKRWRTIARNRRHRSSRNAEKGEDLSTRRRKFHKDALGPRDDELQKLEPNQGDHNMSSQMNDESGQGNGELEFHGNHPEGLSSEFKNEEQARVEGRGGDSGKIVDVEVQPLKAHNTGDKENESTRGGNTLKGQQIEEGQKVQLGKSMEEATAEQQERETEEGDKKDQISESDQVGKKYEATEDLASEGTWKAELDVEESRTKLEEEKEGEEETGEPEF
ncbi:uncharacterized protein LOC127792555 [Diospyros lotus]|uniref:uncharacterized protein LOC127792555 n=1 Tax=Diospyros lotus TaxID=55363 RepID=UPI0022528800|nr:uncharacterized protein LOC127792555 [Diospyros lotus]